MNFAALNTLSMLYKYVDIHPDVHHTGRELFVIPSRATFRICHFSL